MYHQSCIVLESYIFQYPSFSPNSVNILYLACHLLTPSQMFQLILLMQESMSLSNICDPFHPNKFTHMDVVTIETFFNFVIELKKFWNTITTNQHWYIRRLEVICLTKNLVHILHGCFLHPLIKNSFQISRKSDIFE